MGYERNDRGGQDRGGEGYGRDSGRGYGSQGGGRDYRGDRFGDRDRGYERSSGYGNDRGSYGADRDRGYGRDYGRAPQGFDYQDRGFFDRAGDEVRSWFGDEEAERRRRQDERYDQQQGGRGYGEGRSSSYGSSYSGQGASYGYGSDRGGYGSGDQGRGYGQGNYGQGNSGQGQGNYGQGNYGQDRNDRGHDAGYQSWRDRQIQALDQDYDDYRREHQSKFDNEFATWRTGRQGQRDMASKVQEHAEVVGSDSKHVGTVDHVRGHDLLLTKNDQDAGGQHHIVPSSWIQSVDGGKVVLNKTADQAKAQWRDVQNDQGARSVFSRDADRGQGDNGADASASSRAFTRS